MIVDYVSVPTWRCQMARRSTALVEVAFLNHPEEEVLRAPGFQQAAAQAFSMGLSGTLLNTPPGRRNNYGEEAAEVHW